VQSLADVELVAFDLDGTILEHGELIMPECRAAIRRIDQLGVRCVINSGRSTAFQYDLLSRFDLLGQFDALIGDERWIDLIDGDGGHRRVPFEPWTSQVADRWAELEADAEQWCLRLDERARERGWQPVLMSGEEGRRRGLWAIWFEVEEQALELLDWLEPQLDKGKPQAEPGQNPLAANTNGGFIHIYDRRYDKGSSLAAVADHFGIANEHVLAIGDNVNDRPMLDGRHGFSSATIANARPEISQLVRRAGGRVAERPSGLGVADLLAELIGARLTGSSAVTPG
jgi:hydroxymethylpyrimidine pyrophosphatase-like HAD family hydrolase